MTPLTVATTPSLGAGHVMKNARYSPAATATPPGQLPNTQGMDPCIPGVAGASDYGKDEGLCWKNTLLHRMFHYDLAVLIAGLAGVPGASMWNFPLGTPYSLLNNFQSSSIYKLILYQNTFGFIVGGGSPMNLLVIFVFCSINQDQSSIKLRLISRRHYKKDRSVLGQT